jgi:hypothetical protein
LLYRDEEEEFCRELIQLEGDFDEQFEINEQTWN